MLIDFAGSLTIVASVLVALAAIISNVGIFSKG